jgi:hypothetical protein
MWHINSTAHGGGVAEMLPRVVFALRELGVCCEWLVLSPAADKRAEFFSLTKFLHNGIHGTGPLLSAWAGCGRERAVTPGRAANDEALETCSAEQRAQGLASMRALMSEVCDEAARVFFQSFCLEPDAARDVIILHDPQPLALVAALKARCPGVRVVFRCHIGLDAENAVTDDAWAFLAPWVDACDKLVFSNAAYVPPRWRAKATIIAPGIAPIAPKNRDLSAWEVVQVLTRAGLMGYEERADVATPRGCELIDAPFASLAKIHKRADSGAIGGVCSGGGGGSGGGEGRGGGVCTACEGVVAPSSAIPFLHRPIVLQVSRFDRLKGFRALLLAFRDMKERPEHYAAISGLPHAAATDAAPASTAERREPLLFSQLHGAPGSGDASGDAGDGAASSPHLSVRPHDRQRHKKMINACVLVLAGPDPGGVSDDPEALEVLEELKRLHDELPRDIACDIKIVELPMGNTLGAQAQEPAAAPRCAALRHAAPRCATLRHAAPRRAASPRILLAAQRTRSASTRCSAPASSSCRTAFARASA